MRTRIETGSNFVTIHLGKLSIAHSYQTVIAFKDGVNPWRVSENLWGSTTGKHLNAIDGGKKSIRLKRPEFEALYEKTLRSYGLID
jgi:hypothetical protein